jgi:putative aldouronate transport system permease protein
MGMALGGIRVKQRAKGGRLASSLAVLYRDRYLLLIFAVPLIYYLVFHYGPMYGVLIAFKDYRVAKGIWASPWVGFKHFANFLSDGYFWKLVRNTVLLNLLSILFGFPAPVLLALLLNEVGSYRYKRFVQTVSYLPHFISTVVVCGMIVNALSTDGPMNALLASVGMKKIPFMIRPEWFRFIYVSSGIWQGVGWGSIIYLAALTNVNPEIYEAAIIDGTNRLQRVVHVNLPCIMPTVTIMFILAVGSILGIAFEKVLLLQNAMTMETSDVIQTFVYRRGLLDVDFSFATAVGTFQSVIGLIFLSTTNYLSRHLGEVSLW